MYFVGLDVHLRHTTICILDANGVKLKQGQLRGPWSLIAEELKTLPGPVAVCYEASCGYGFLHDLLAQVVDRVVVAHPENKDAVSVSLCKSMPTHQRWLSAITTSSM